VRLEDGDHPRPSTFSGRLQRSPQFGGVVGIIIDHRDPVSLSLQLKAPYCPAERTQRRSDLLRVQTQFGQSGKTSQGIEDVVAENRTPDPRKRPRVPGNQRLPRSRTTAPRSARRAPTPEDGHPPHNG